MIRVSLSQDRPIRFGTRGSALALAQTRLVVERFQAAFPDLTTEIHVIRTEGDLDQLSPLTEIGGRGVFTNAIEAAILRGEVDAAVHSAKDLPSQLHPDVPIVAFPVRDDPRDVLVSRHGATLDQLPANPVIGTSSRRRDVQITRLRPDARTKSIRGNIDTRLRKAESEEFDAIVLAAAGIRRMGWDDRITEVFPVESLVPAPGQGALAVQARAGSEAAALLSAIDDPAVSRPVRIERAFLAAIGVGCSYPLGAHASLADTGFYFVAMLADSDGQRIATASERLDVGNEEQHTAIIAARLADRIDARSTGPGRSWGGWDRAGHALAGARVVVTRPRHQAGPLLAALAARGADPLSLPTISIEPVANTTELDDALVEATRGGFDWLAFTSVNAVSVVATRAAALGIAPDRLATLRVAAVGAATAAAASDAGFSVALVPPTATAEAMADELCARIRPGDRVLYPRSAIGREVLPERLRRHGAVVAVINAYRTLPEPNVDPAILDRVKRGDIDAILFASPSSVRNLVVLLGSSMSAVANVPAICAGPVTARAAREAGFRRIVVSDGPDPEATVAATADHLSERHGGNRPPAKAELVPLAGRSAD